jgi:ribonuclease J
MRVRIHRGAEEVGGNCVEVELDGARLVLDLGWPLGTDLDVDLPLPAVSGLATGDDPLLLGVILSHAHFDHYGLLTHVAPTVPIYPGAAAARILRESAFYTGMGLVMEPAGFLGHRQRLTLGPFQVTGYLNDHSAFDAYSLLVEGGGRRLFYTGDLRAHGRKASLFEELVRQPPSGVDVLLMEGTHIREDAAVPERGLTERDVEDACVETFRRTDGPILAMYSPQNIDRLVTLYRAALRSDRVFVMDLYAAAITAATGRATIPQADWDRVRVYLPRSQKRRIIQTKAFERTNAVQARRIYPEEVRRMANQLVMPFRLSMTRELENMDCLAGARCVWSLWPGYLHQESGTRLREWLDRHGIPMVVQHASGHASIADLQRLVSAMAPTRVVPIHSDAGDRFPEFFPRVDRQHDGIWWEV